MLVEELHMAAQVVGRGEFGHQLVDDPLFVGVELKGVRGVDGGEVARAHRGLGAVGKAHAAAPGIDLVEQQAILHVELGVAQDNLPLELKEQHVHGLDERLDAVVLTVGALGKGHELAERDAVVVLKDLVVSVAQVVAQHRGDAGGLPRGCTHPHDIVVAPLDIE